MDPDLGHEKISKIDLGSQNVADPTNPDPIQKNRSLNGGSCEIFAIFLLCKKVKLKPDRRYF